MLIQETRLPQHLQALQLANTIRFGRIALRRDIRAGRTTVADVLRDPPTEARTMTLGCLLTSQHLWGTTRTRALLRRLGLAESKPLGTLTARQTELLLAELTA